MLINKTTILVFLSATIGIAAAIIEHNQKLGFIEGPINAIENEIENAKYYRLLPDFDFDDKITVWEVEDTTGNIFHVSVQKAKYLGFYSIYTVDDYHRVENDSEKE